MTCKDIIDTEKRTPSQNTRTLLATFCVTFTVTMVVCLVFGTLFADEESKQSIMYSWSVLGVCACVAVLQFVFFTPTLIKQMAYPTRLLLFGVCLYVVLAALAVVMSWLPTEMVGARVTFTVMYLIILVVATALFAVKHRHEERILNERLCEYRRKNSYKHID
ncbi:DUF3021 family protein [Adlercreutzia sp. ZJ138]|uniref:DUF3021 family protein n=1 Tax=Adlercreutzia sp. ZJ138 TaxID=2709405 RepID=UPI0013EB7632